MNALLELFNFKSADYASNLSEGLLVFLIGFAAVFAVLTIILAVLSLFNVFFGNASKKTKPAPAPVAVAAPKAVSSDDEIIAVIAAAIAAAESESAGSKYRVVSFKRK